MQAKTVAIYGDSIMKGAVMDERQRYRSIIAQYINEISEHYNLNIVNNSRFGITIEKGIELIKKDVIAGKCYDYALIEFGGNDCSFNWPEVSREPEKEHLPLTILDRFVEVLENIIVEVKKMGAKPVLMTLPPIDSLRYLDFISKNPGDKTNILRWLGDANRIYRFQEMYSLAISHLANITNTLVVDVRSKFLSKHNLGELIGPDGIHLAPEGYIEVAGAFKGFIENVRRTA